MFKQNRLLINQKNRMYIIIALGVFFVGWNVWGFYSSNVEQAEYIVIERTTGYEIRVYALHIEAQTKVSGAYDDALNEGFRIIAGYIFGDNVKKEGIAMTAPVRETAVSENTPMTAPVIASGEDKERTVAFVMPKSYTLATLPEPNDARVKLVEVPEKKMAVLRFSGFWGSEKILKKQVELLSYLLRDGIATVGVPSFAGYNGPFTPPWLNRHEVMIEVE